MFKDELKYWIEQIRDGGEASEEMKGRHRGELKYFPEMLLPLIEQVGGVPAVLDVGAGPLSQLTYGAKVGKIKLIAVDPLMQEYVRELSKGGYGPAPYIKLKVYAEELSRVFTPGSFDLVWCHNALDHSQDPKAAVGEMVNVCKPGGFIILQGWSNEGTAEGFFGLHKHDLFVFGGALMLQSLKEGGALSLPVNIEEGLGVERVERAEDTKRVKEWIKIVWRKL